jgi:uncharacterized membrane protein
MSFARLPEDIQEQARRAYRLFRTDPNHPGLRSLDFLLMTLGPIIALYAVVRNCPRPRRPHDFSPNGPNLIVLYSIIPWIGVMAAGYAFGKILLLESTQRTRLCLTIGFVAIALFLVLVASISTAIPAPGT